MSPPRYAIPTQIDPACEPDVSQRRLAALARRALAAESVAAGGELTLVIADDETVRGLNRRYRGDDAPTDVLSFGSDGDGFPAEDVRHVGDIVISHETARRQAAEAGEELRDELDHLLVHGVLHLLGYDHESAADARRMRAREEELLGRAVH